MAITERGSQIVIREMTADDLREVHRIERAAYQDAWPARAFQEELRNGFAQYLVAVERDEADGPGAETERGRGWRAAFGRLFSAGRRERLLGFAGAWFMVDQLHIVTVAVNPPAQGRGIGHRLLLACYDLATEAELGSIVLEVRESNARAQQLYEHFGFRTSGRQVGYYKDNNEDALVMETPRIDAAYRARMEALREQYTSE